MSGEMLMGSNQLLEDVRLGRRSAVWSMPDGTTRPKLDRLPVGVLSGAFNPLHAGHVAMGRAASAFLGGNVVFELSIVNVDKPPLDLQTVEIRRRQFQEPVLMTAAPRFVEKAAILKNTTFVVGVDTLERIIQLRYYGDDEASLCSALASIRSFGCRFLVAGRKLTRIFTTLSDVPIPRGFEDLFVALPESRFRSEFSSSQLRKQGG